MYGIVPDAHATTLRLGEADEVMPSTFFECNLWRANAMRLFGLHKREGVMRVDQGSDVSQSMKSAANRLVAILRFRFKVFLKRRIKQKSRRDHWSMKFAFRNLPVVAAILVLNGHVKSDLEYLNETDSLLVTNLSCFVKCGDWPDGEGAHLYFDMVGCAHLTRIWILCLSMPFVRILLLLHVCS